MTELHDRVTRIIREEKRQLYASENDRIDALAAAIITGLKETGSLLSETPPVDIIENAIWEGFEAAENCYTDREMDVIDTGGNYDSFHMNPVAQHVLNAIKKIEFNYCPDSSLLNWGVHLLQDDETAIPPNGLI